ncbi:MAG TPA: tRNA lysidine(34) synthetase TilS [Frankiaceae bacterium]|nr:tRNA lysidine(34) synthetase TilS [Frankiaceae bacterium]
MAGPDPAVADVRRAVRRVLATPVTYAAVSGGADSLALLAALAWEAPRHDVTARCVTVDHGLRAGSAEQAARVVARAHGLGVETTVVTVTPDGTDEDAARRARYAALDALPEGDVLLGHTRDDQAEQVLLGLARGSGARSLSGMPERRGRYVRPFLDLPRETTEAACAALGLEPWSDPANADLRYARNRARHVALPALEEALGPGVRDALARTAALLRDDADLLDEVAMAAYAGVGLDANALADLPPAIRRRVLLRAARDAGATDLSAGHVAAIDALLTNWHGQGPVDLPGGLVAVRSCDTLAFRTP